MSEPEDKSETRPEAKKPLTLEEIVSKLAADTYENREAINTIAKALVELNKKIEAKGGGGAGGQDDAAVEILKRLFPESKGGSLEDLAKTAESLTKAADALDRFRNPSRIGLGEALLMRAGLRATYPRYMTKKEIEKAEKALGAWEALEGEEGETEHVT